MSQDVCPWNVRFSKELPNESPYAAREVLAAKDARQLARELLGITQAEFSAAFGGSPMKRAKLRGLKRNAAIVLGNPSLRSGQAASATLPHLFLRGTELPAVWCPDLDEGAHASNRHDPRRIGGRRGI